tara:strand:- start:233 stop:1555 length:1323 start_codon:yes stop_codon:yes gene_type:complete
MGLFSTVTVTGHRRRTKTGKVAQVRRHTRTIRHDVVQRPLGRPDREPWTGVIDFASGSNHAGEIRGLHEAGHPIGVAAPEVFPAAERALTGLAGRHHPVFIDSGAYSEVTFNFPNKKGKLKRPDLSIGIHVTSPISEAQWDKRLDLYERLALSLGDQLYVVGPDMVGHQTETLERVGKYRDRVRRLGELGANVMMPVQKGALSMAEFDRQIEETLGHGDFIRAIPMKKDATSVSELVDFLRDRQPDRVHLLGLGGSNRTAERILQAVKDAVPGVIVSMDSTKITAKSARSGGTGHPDSNDPTDKRRPLTVASDEAKIAIWQEAHLGARDLHAQPDGVSEDRPIALDYTDAIGEPSTWLSDDEAVTVSDGANLSAEDAADFHDDPDGFLQGEAPNGMPWYMDPGMEESLDAAWARFVDSQTVVEKKRRSVRSTFMHKDPTT